MFKLVLYVGLKLSSLVFLVLALVASYDKNYDHATYLLLFSMYTYFMGKDADA